MNRAADAFLSKVLGPQWPLKTIMKFIGRYKFYDIYVYEEVYYRYTNFIFFSTWDSASKKPVPHWVKPFL